MNEDKVKDLLKEVIKEEISLKLDALASKVDTIATD